MACHFQRNHKKTELAEAEALGVDVTVVRNWDQKRRRPRFEPLIALAHVLKVSQDEIVAAFTADAKSAKQKKGRK